MALVTSMCFFGTVGYAVLLRDMLQPITDKIWNHDDSLPTGGPTFHNNLTMLTVCLLVTPLCTLRTLTSLKRFGAFSMFSILILGVIICYRSIQCNMGEALLEPVTDDGDDASDDAHKQHFAWKTFKLLPDKWKDLLDVFPLFVSCYVCHYNLLPVHNEFKCPSAKRVAWWLRVRSFSSAKRAPSEALTHA
jgi:amino acid permease